jgi:hypothetical protein
VFRTREIRLGRGVLYTPGTTVPTRPRMLRDRRLPHRSGASLISPVLHPAREVMLTRHHQGFPVSRPVPSLPLTCGPGRNGDPRAFPRASHPAVTGRACRGGDRSRTLTRSHVTGISQPPLQRTHSSRATSRRRHFACLLAWCYSSPVSLRPVVRFSRSPDWPDVTPGRVGRPARSRVHVG